MIEELREIRDTLFDMWSFDRPENESTLTSEQSLEVIHVALQAMNVLRFRGWESEELIKVQKEFYYTVYENNPECQTYDARERRGEILN